MVETNDLESMANQTVGARIGRIGSRGIQIWLHILSLFRAKLTDFRSGGRFRFTRRSGRLTCDGGVD
jgi:hypothetical protein